MEIVLSPFGEHAWKWRVLDEPSGATMGEGYADSFELAGAAARAEVTKVAELDNDAWNARRESARKRGRRIPSALTFVRELRERARLLRKTGLVGQDIAAAALEAAADALAPFAT